MRAFRATLLVSPSAGTTPTDVVAEFAGGLRTAWLTFDYAVLGDQVEVAVRFPAETITDAVEDAKAGAARVASAAGLVRSLDPVRVRQGRLSAAERASLAR